MLCLFYINLWIAQRETVPSLFLAYKQKYELCKDNNYLSGYVFHIIK